MFRPKTTFITTKGFFIESFNLKIIKLLEFSLKQNHLVPFSKFILGPFYFGKSNKPKSCFKSKKKYISFAIYFESKLFEFFFIRMLLPLSQKRVLFQKTLFFEPDHVFWDQLKKFHKLKGSFTRNFIINKGQ